MKAMRMTTGLKSAILTSVAGSKGTISNSGSLAAGVLGLEAQLFFLVLHEPADHLPPQRLGQLRWQALLAGANFHLVDHLLDTPGNVRISGLGLQLPGAVDVAEALGDEVDKRGVDAVDLVAHLAHVGAVPRFTSAH